MNISLKSEPYWDYYGALSALLNRIRVMAEGGQLLTQGTDIMSPALLAEAKQTVAQFENFSQAIATVSATLKQNLSLSGG